MTSILKLTEQKENILKNLKDINIKLDEELSKTLVRCEGLFPGIKSYAGCGMGFQIRELCYIQTHWYEGPYGCTEGDTWHQGEGNWVCPSCGSRHRLYDKPEIEELKHLFKEIVNEYKG